jgi:hypothetical protein
MQGPRGHRDDPGGEEGSFVLALSVQLMAQDEGTSDAHRAPSIARCASPVWYGVSLSRRRSRSGASQEHGPVAVERATPIVFGAVCFCRGNRYMQRGGLVRGAVL